MAKTENRNHRNIDTKCEVRTQISEFVTGHWTLALFLPGCIRVQCALEMRAAKRWDKRLIPPLFPLQIINQSTILAIHTLYKRANAPKN